MRNLTLCNTTRYSHSECTPESMVTLANVLRDYSQGLESLRVDPFDLDGASFLAFDEAVHDRDETWGWEWPVLGPRELNFFSDWPYRYSSRVEISDDEKGPDDNEEGVDMPPPYDVVIATGHVNANAIPFLKSARVEVGCVHKVSCKRELCDSPEGFRNGRVSMFGWSKSSTSRVLKSWSRVVELEPAFHDQSVW